ncbi:unnamed protein product [Brassicogethes aeneus]|uniref:Uncharacterized protein n=1 Tax=Brassicogethes aeneus TaxID=1431903 RepID=A0A9P0ASF9_BRAAE|nr:unnamed protein product [Brassicogethes aeneus]
MPPKKGSNSNPVKEKFEESDSEKNVEAKQSEVSLENNIAKLLEIQFAKFKEDMERTYRNEISEVKKSIGFMSDCFEQQKEELKKTLKALKNVQEENNTIKNKMSELENRINNKEQLERENNLIISGVPKQNETTTTIVEKIMNTLKLQNSQSILETRRISKKDDSPILVKFAEKNKKVEVFKNRKEIKSVKCSDCQLEGNSQIYFNDDLIPNIQTLFQKARDVKKRKGI